MAYRLKSGKLTGKALRKVSVEQAESALEALSKEAVLPADIHESRKAVKRVRSLLKLLEPALSAGTFRDRYKGIGKAADLLAGARDLHVLEATLDKLEQRFGNDIKPVAEAVRAMVEAEAPSSAPRLSPKDLEHAKQIFAREARKLAKLHVQGEGFELIGAGLEESYRTAKKNFALAYRRPSDERFHELRKAVQWHWRHMVLLSRCWPEYFALRVEACRELAECLGDDHDLAVLLEVVRRHPDQAVRTKAEKAARVRQKELRGEAFAVAERLFAESPKAFARRMASYWACKAALPVRTEKLPAKAE